LKRTIRRILCQRWRQEKRIKLLQTALLQKSSNKQTLSGLIKSKNQAIANIITAAKEFLTPVQLKLFDSQMKSSIYKRRGLRWSTAEKLTALQLHYKSAKAYRYLASNLALPSKVTLSNFIKRCIGDMLPGQNGILLTLLQMRMKSMGILDRQCVLVFDEMSLRKQLFYSKKLDIIIGFTDDGQPASHALVFMIRGLASKWKQAVQFYFTHNTVTTNALAKYLQEVVEKIHGIGLTIQCIVCDQGTTNVAVLKQLGLSLEQPSVQVSTYLIPVIFDVPHLLKNIRNNLINHDIMVDGKQVSWKHIKAVYEADKKCALRMLPKLKDEHINPTLTGKMRVCLAAQVFSHAMSAAIKTRVSTNELSSNALDTAEFIDKIDDLFDILNSRLLYADKPGRCAITAISNHLMQLQEYCAWVSRWSFVDVTSMSRIKCHWGMRMSITSITSVVRNLLDTGFQFVCTARMTQDCLENFFAGIRSCNGWNENPSAYHFCTAFRSAVVLSSLDNTSSGKNCLSDEDVTLLSTQEVLEEQKKHQDVSTEASLHNNITVNTSSHMKGNQQHATDTNETITSTVFTSSTEPVLNEILCSFNNDDCSNNYYLNIDYTKIEIEVFDAAEETMINYLSGWLCRKYSFCSDCTSTLSQQKEMLSIQNEAVVTFTNTKRYQHSAATNLITPSEELCSIVKTMEHTFRQHFHNLKTTKHLAATLFNITKPKCNYDFLFRQHPQHAQLLSEILTQAYINMRIFYAVKFNNTNEASKMSASRAIKSAQSRKMEKILHK